VRTAVGLLVAAAVLATAASASSRRATPSHAWATICSAFKLPPPTRAGEVALWGHIRSLTRTGRRYELRFDPALWLSGVTANRAAAEDGRTVDNDYYVRDESHRLLTYLVPTSARATVIINRGTEGLCSLRIPIAELAQIVRGKNPQRRLLFGRRLGYWIRATGDTVRSLDQQYQP